MRERGVTLVEMMIVVTIVGVAAAVSFPSVNSGLDSLRLTSASDSIVSFLNGALNRAERRQEAVEVTISKSSNTLAIRTSDPNFIRQMGMPDGVTIAKIHPEIQEEENVPRVYLVQPGGTIPRFGIEIVNRRGQHRIVRVDPITGVARVEILR